MFNGFPLNWENCICMAAFPSFLFSPQLLHSSWLAILRWLWHRSDPPTCQDYFCLGAFAVTLSLSPWITFPISPHSGVYLIQISVLAIPRTDLPFSYMYAPHLSLSTHQSIPCKAYSMEVIWNHKPINRSLYSSLVFLIGLCPIHLNRMEGESSPMLIIAIFSLPKSVRGTYSVFHNYLVSIELKTSNVQDIEDFKVPKSTLKSTVPPILPIL